MKIFFLIGIASLTLLIGCTENINLKVAAAPPQIVIEGSIQNGSKAEVMITRNSPLTAPVNFSNILVTDAKVYVSSGGIIDTLTLGIDSTAAIPYLYIGKNIIGAVGQSYHLTVIEGGQSYVANTTIPSLVSLDSVWWQKDPPHDTLGFAWARFSEPAGLGNAYRWYAKNPTKHVMFQGKEIVLNRRFVPADGASFNDKFIDGKIFNFSEDRGYDPTEATYTATLNQKELGYYKPTDTIYIKFCTIDNATYTFYSTFEAELNTNGNPFASPVTILGNISNGALGVWGGFGATYDTIYPH